MYVPLQVSLPVVAVPEQFIGNETHQRRPRLIGRYITQQLPLRVLGFPEA